MREQGEVSVGQYNCTVHAANHSPQTSSDSRAAGMETDWNAAAHWRWNVSALNSPQLLSAARTRQPMAGRKKDKSKQAQVGSTWQQEAQGGAGSSEEAGGLAAVCRSRRHGHAASSSGPVKHCSFNSFTALTFLVRLPWLRSSITRTECCAKTRRPPAVREAGEGCGGEGNGGVCHACNRPCCRQHVEQPTPSHLSHASERSPRSRDLSAREGSHGSVCMQWRTISFSHCSRA